VPLDFVGDRQGRVAQADGRAGAAHWPSVTAWGGKRLHRGNLSGGHPRHPWEKATLRCPSLERSAVMANT
jgi:hypothetical protein